jgi:hypothetical protein
MNLIPSQLWVIFGLVAAALLVNAIYPLLAALLGIVATLLFLWLLLGGGR